MKPEKVPVIRDVLHKDVIRLVKKVREARLRSSPVGEYFAHYEHGLTLVPLFVASLLQSVTPYGYQTEKEANDAMNYKNRLFQEMQSEKSRLPSGLRNLGTNLGIATLPVLLFTPLAIPSVIAIGGYATYKILRKK